MTPGMRRAALAVLAGCGVVALGVGAFWLAAESAAHLMEVSRG